MKSRIIGITLFFIMLIAGVSVFFVHNEKQNYDSDSNGELIVSLNEVEQLINMGETQKAAEKAALLKDTIRRQEKPVRENSGTFIICIIGCIFAVTVFGYVYFSILRPFDKMKAFAEKIAQGNFDIPLKYERSNYFGSFTWAFDSMRREITKARACEREAIDNNKTVIATLSHDIKTPVSSIRAYAEGLDANLDSSPEKRRKYLSVIMRKCDEVSKLTNDLFLHTLSDLDKLKIHPEQLELTEFMENTVKEIAAEHDDISFIRPNFTAEVSADRNRLMQITENLINNARKYAHTDINISMELEQHDVLIRFRDFGSGIPDSDIPFIFGKFYRGKNSGNEQGSGLGLYIVKYLTEAQNGEVSLRNLPDGGLEVTISLPLLNSGSS
ncbi:Signal transduction histidine kinase [Ruminococcus flavefaciens]|uniref:histidine kinase n=1 Tax=Ruminococcus flavefaciens TaxID=1265 RepID=A0A1H6I5C8_RUMFL|nr:HAMP domain-containing sensor histidine kinase [Ruminococcus flavefaciens]SEH42768.1 Signal transduction histidine kinase [Ruminococcus flavefaciens]